MTLRKLTFRERLDREQRALAAYRCFAAAKTKKIVALKEKVAELEKRIEQLEPASEDRPPVHKQVLRIESSKSEHDFADSTRIADADGSGF